MQNHHAKCSAVETLVFVLLIAGFASGAWSAQKKGPEKKSAGKSVAIPNVSVKDAPVVVSALCTDGSNLKLTILDKQIRLKTRFGVLVIPVAEIHRIDLATRFLEGESIIINARILELGSSNYKERKAATETLHHFGRKAYPALLDISNHSDLEVVTRAKKLIKDLEAEIPEELLEVRDRDVIYTEDSKISGWIEAEALHVKTAQFGKQTLKLYHVCMLRSPNAVDPEPKNVLPDPGSLRTYQGHVGKTFVFRVTGLNQQPGGFARGAVWGTDTYTLDSDLASAAVHAGVVKAGETRVVKVKILEAQQTFNGSLRNGVRSNSYGVYPGGYTFVK